MLINLVTNEDIKIDTTLNIKPYKNTLDIIDISPIRVLGYIYPTYTTIEYNLAVSLSVSIEDYNNHCIKKIDLAFKIDETEEVSKENLHINEKTLDLNTKIWENIVVEIFSESSNYDLSLTSGDGWTLYQDDNDDDGVDERLKPLLDLLNTNEEV